MKYLITAIALFPILCFAQNTLTISVEGMQSSDGFLGIGVYNMEEDFPEVGKTYTGSFTDADTDLITVSFADLPSGIYAVSIFHDKNGNKKLDTNFIGYPKESVAFSNNQKIKTFGPPSFKECAIAINSDVEITLHF